MNRKIIKYKLFKSTEEFEQWQKEGDIKNVSQIIPHIMSIGMNLNETKVDENTEAQGTGNTVMGVFVTYITDIDATDTVV